MTPQEQHLISSTRIMVIGPSTFISHLTDYLRHIGFPDLHLISANTPLPGGEQSIIIEFIGNNSSGPAQSPQQLPVICAFDFVDGAGAMVILPGDDCDILATPEPRLQAAKYMDGYCAFWNIEDSDWLHYAMPRIEEGLLNETAQQTAALLCARIAASIAVGRPVRHFPRFYLVRNPD